MSERTGECVDCREQFAAGQRGVMPVRCAGCRRRHKKSQERAWRVANAEHRRLKGAEWRRQNPERNKEKNDRFWQRHPEYKKEWYARNRSTVIERAARFNQAHPDRMAVARKDWLDRNPSYPAEKEGRRRAAKAGTGSEPFKTADVLAIHGWTCALCSDPIEPALRHPHPRSLSVDHRIPLSRGGSHTVANVQPAHLDCNTRKGARIE